MDACRAINEMVFAMLFVVAVGLGPVAGVLALFIHTTGVLSKLLSEAVEAIEPGPVEGIRATGANKLEEILYETTKDKIYDFFMNYGKTPEEKAVLERLGWAPFRASSDLQLVPIRQLALFKEMQSVKENKGLNEQDKLAKTTAIQAQLDDLDRLNNALSAMSSVSKAVQ